MARNALLAVLVWLVVAFVPTFLFSDYHLFQLTMVIDSIADLPQAIAAIDERLAAGERPG